MVTHPNDVDRMRIQRAIGRRARYRYVSPTVASAAHGYHITSPCCSRNVDPDGGTIDIALLEFSHGDGHWQLYRKNHAAAQWQLHAEYPTLQLALDELNADPDRVFWQ